MVSIKVIALLLFVLPALIVAAKATCKVTVSQQLADSGRYNTYTATATNTGGKAVSNVVLTSSSTPRSVDGLTKLNSGGYKLPSGLAAGNSYSFTYTAKSGTNIRWTSTCSTSTASATTAPTPAATAAPGTAKATATPTTVKATATPSTVKATSSPTTAKTTTTTKPATSTGGKLCPAGSWWAPAPLTTWQWQLTGSIDTSKNVQMYDIDLFDATSSVVSTLHGQGKAVICYFSTQFEDWRPDASSFTSAVKGKALDGWEGENYVDIRSTVVRNAMKARLDLAVSKNCDGVEPDNVDGYQSSTGFPLTAADQASFNQFLAAEAHARGLSIGLKNDLDQAKTLEPYFDWALNEECYSYSECSTLSVFVQKGKAVFNTEYSGDASKICPSMNTLKFSSLIKNLDLDASIKSQCCTYGSCSPAAYTCKSSSSARSERSVDDNMTIDTEFATQEALPTAAAATTYASVFVAAAVALVAVLNF